MVLRPLEYSECVTDSPFFRETLLAHEKELENTAESIKVLVKACKRLLAAQKGEGRQLQSRPNALYLCVLALAE